MPYVLGLELSDEGRLRELLVTQILPVATVDMLLTDPDAHGHSERGSEGGREMCLAGVRSEYHGMSEQSCSCTPYMTMYRLPRIPI